MTEDLSSVSFDDYFAKKKRQEARRQSVATVLGRPDPAAATSAVQVGTALGVPPEAVIASPAQFGRQLEQNNLAKELENAPGLTGFMANPINGAIAKEATPKLSKIEQYLTNVLRSNIKAADVVAETIGETNIGEGIRSAGTGLKQMAVGVAALPTSSAISASTARLDTYQKASDLDRGMSLADVGNALGTGPMSLETTMAFDFLQGDEERRGNLVNRAVGQAHRG